jgi:multicomponent Na+:H+ antiporter subunit E
MILALLLFWFILSGKVSIFFIVAAIVSIAIVTLIDRKLFFRCPLILGVKLNWIIFIFKLFKEMGISTIEVSKLVWFKPQSISPCCNWIECKLEDEALQTIYANSITLTPGTMSMGIKDNKILVHALTSSMMQELLNGTLEKQVSRLK